MTLHNPSHPPAHIGLPNRIHLGAEARHTLHDLGIALAATLLVALGVWAALQLQAGTPAWLMATPDRSQIEFRASERDAFAAGRTTEGSSLIEFRAAERAGQ
jgi:hypothetical protein